MSYLIINAQEMAMKHPDTFNAPKLEALNAIEPGDFVKICVEEDGVGERFWLKVIGRDHVFVTGFINNHLAIIKSLKFGEELKVKLTDIYQILPNLQKII